MRRNSKMCNLVSSVQISGFPVHQGTQEAKDGIVYSAPGWDIKESKERRITPRQIRVGDQNPKYPI